jgi:hypothetical protein
MDRSDYIKDLHQAELQISSTIDTEIPDDYKTVFEYHWEYFWNAIKTRPIGELSFIQHTYKNHHMNLQCSNMYKIPCSSRQDENDLNMELSYDQYEKEILDKKEYIEEGISFYDWYYVGKFKYIRCSDDNSGYVHKKFIIYLAEFIYFKTGIKTDIKVEKSPLGIGSVLTIKLDYQ